MLVVRRWTEAGVTTLRCTRPEKPHKASSLSGRWMRVGCGIHNGHILALGLPRTMEKYWRAWTRIVRCRYKCYSPTLGEFPDSSIRTWHRTAEWLTATGVTFTSCLTGHVVRIRGQSTSARLFNCLVVLCDLGDSVWSTKQKQLRGRVWSKARSRSITRCKRV